MALQGVTMPPPSGGLNLVSPVDEMEPNEALELVNVFPGAGAPVLRKGYEKFVLTGATINGAIKTMTTLSLADGTTQLIVATATKLYSISEVGVVTDISKAGNYTNGDWQTVTYNNRLYLTNGADAAQVYSGIPATPAADVTFTGSGLSISNLINVTAHRESLYFVEKNTCNVWYSAIRTTGTTGTPTLTKFDFSFVFERGGFLVAIGSYSNTSSYATQEYFWACSSEGELVFYAGSNPGATDWQIIGAHYIGAPLGYRSFIRVNSDVWVITAQGIVPLSALFKLDPQLALAVVSEKINPIITQYARIDSFDSNWTGFFWPEGRRVFVSVPLSTTLTFFLVYSTDKQTWTKYILQSGNHAVSSCTFKRLPFYGGLDGTIWQGETGNRDAVVSNVGSNINFVIQTAFSFYGQRGNYKTWRDLRPILKASSGLQVNVAMYTDFKDYGTESFTSFNTDVNQFTPWGSPWGSPWSTSQSYIFDRYATAGQGHCASISFKGNNSNNSIEFLAFEVRFDLGGQV